MKDLSKLKRLVQLGSWSFNLIDISDMDLYSEYIKKTEYPANLWTANFAFVWAVSQSETKKMLWKIVDDMLVTFTYLRSDELYMTFLPYGKGNADKVVDVVYKCLKYCYEYNNHEDSSTVVKVVNSMQLDFLRQSANFDKLFKVKGWVGMEKHFSISKLLTLPGKEFEYVRRKINKFHKLCPNAIIRDYRPEDFDEVMKLAEYWSNTSGAKYSFIFDRVYFREIIKHYKELNHTILIVELDEKIIGLSTGGDLPNGQSWWCISKFMNDYDGLSELLIVEMAKRINKINPNIEIMNAAEDLGPGGLRFFKERFRPVLDLRRYLLKLR